MKNLIKYKNRIYRKYATDLWGQVIMKGKVTRMFKFLMQVFQIKLKKIYFKTGYGKSRKYKKKFINVYKHALIKKMKIYNNKKDININLNEKQSSIYKQIEKNTFDKYGIQNDEDLYLKEFNKKNYYGPADNVEQFFVSPLFMKRAELPYYENFNRGSLLPYNNSLNKWKIDFMFNFNKLYFLKYKFNLKKKNSLKNYLISARRSKFMSFYTTKNLSETIRIQKKQDFWKNRKKRTLLKLMDESYDYRNKLNSYTTWLDCERRFKAKKFTNWWKLRGTIRKISIFYGILSLKKFRYVERFISRKNSLRFNYVFKLETMVNIILFRSNLFSNIYFSNNFIRNGGILLNDKIVIYPFRFMKLSDVLVINKKYFKKIFNIFFKKLFFSKKILKKNNKYFNYNKLNATKFLLNKPNYLEINYKILHIILWRLPNRKELKGISFASTKSIYDWSIDAEVDYQ